MSDSNATELLRKLRRMLGKCRRTEKSGFDTYWITAVALDASLDELEQAVDATLGAVEWPTDTEGVRIDVADTVHMLRSDYDGDHEWEDVVTEISYVKYGGDKWVVRGARGEAWACECTVTGHDDELYENSDDWGNLPTPWDERDGSRWSELFGTPERAAKTIADNCAGESCSGCPGIGAERCGVGDYAVLLEWLRGKAVSWHELA